MDMVFEQESDGKGPDGGVDVVTPVPTLPEVVASMASGGCTLLLEPIMPNTPGAPITFACTAGCCADCSNTRHS